MSYICDVKPIISIITVTYNCESIIEATIKSVLNQTYPNIEYILIDGASTDNTLAIIQKYKPFLAQALSESDNGLYDAMNKGQKLATGDFIWFLNAGDTIHAKETIAKMMTFYEADVDILYGEVMMVQPDRKPIGLRSEVTTQKTPKHLHWQSLKRGMVVSHQAFLPKLSIVKPYIKDNLAADIDWVIHALKQSKKNVYIPLIFADYEVGGLSKQHHKRSLKDRYVILRKHYGLLPNLWNHTWIIGRAIWYKLTGKSKY